MKLRRVLLLVAFLLLAVWTFAAGEMVPPWSEGTLDIHQISTGRGNAAFIIFPDGTTLLVDAGDAGPEVPHATAVPNDSRRAGEWIARYIRNALPDRDVVELDYAVLTHFHGDHMGGWRQDAPMSSHGDYRLSGISDVAENLPIRHVIDRGWPDYDYPIPLDFPAVANYRRFLDARRKGDGMEVERIKAGRGNQIVPVRRRQAYPSFEVRNLAANGEVWTGVADNTRQQFPDLGALAKEDYPSENMCSIALRISYGSFDYFTGGDLPGVVDTGGPAWNDLETPIARAIGPTDVMVVNHHGSIDPANPYFLGVLRPRVVVLPTWAAGHPAPGVLKRLLSQSLYPGPRDIFATRILEPTAAVIGGRVDRLASRRGHVLIRVAPGGSSYQVLVLDDASEGTRVLSVHGPYVAR